MNELVMNSKNFSYRRAIDNDFTLTLVILVPMFIWGIYLLILVVAGGSSWFFYLSLAATLASPFFMAWRLRQVRRLVEEGERITGKITKVYFDGDRGRIQYVYSYNGDEYKGSAAIHKNDLTRAFQDGQPVDLVLLSDRPERSFLIDLYTR